MTPQQTLNLTSRQLIRLATVLNGNHGYHLLFGIFRGAMRQLALGIAAGSLLSIGSFIAVGTGVWSASGLLVTVAVVMAVVALLAAIGPARRILRIETVEALRVEG